MGVRIWDRLLHGEVALPSGPQLIGRFIMLDGTGRLLAGGRPSASGDYVAADGAWTLWDEASGHSTSGHCDVRDLPEEITVAAVLAIADRLAGADGAGRWLAESPLMQRAELESRVRRRWLDDQIDEHLGALEDVCHRPADRLRVTNRLVPVGAARRIVPATIARLAAHSEDWNRILPDGIEPNVVLAPIREDNFDFYENRVAARLADHLWEDVSRRLGEIDKINALVDDIRRYAKEASSRPWQLHDTLFDLIAGIAQNQPWLDLVAKRKAQLRECRDTLFALRGAGVLPGVKRHAEIGTALRVTNLFINENRYRRVHDLWQAWVDDRTGTGEADRTAQVAEFCRGFADYSALLVLHALDHLQHLGGPDLETRPFTRGGPPLPLSGLSNLSDVKETSVTLAWLDADVFELAADGRPLLRIIPLPHTVAGGGRAGAVHHDLTDLTAVEPAVPSLLMYPGGQGDERRQLPMRPRLLSFSGCDAPTPATARGWSLLPVSPLELDSVMRLARSVRSVLERHRHLGYPVRLACLPSHARTLAEGARWLSVRPDGLALTRPPSPQELATAQARLGELGKRAAGRIDLRGEIEPLDRLAAELPAMVERVAEFATCPVCQHRRPDPWRALRPRSQGGWETYECACDRTYGGQCGTRWGLRVCASCGDRHPVLQAERTLEPAVYDGDELDRRFGSQSTAAPCWLRPSVFICPSCGVCGEAVEGRAAPCQRCFPPTDD